MISDLLTVAEVADIIRCKPGRVRELIRAGRLMAINISTGSRASYRVRRCDVDGFLADSVVAAPPQSQPASTRPVLRKAKHLMQKS